MIQSSVEASFLLLERMELVEKTAFGLVYFFSRCFKIEPFGSVDLRKLLKPAGATRQLNFKSIACDVRYIEISFNSPRINRFAAALLNRIELDECAVHR